MANTKNTRERVAALLAQPDKATHDAITELQQALAADVATWQARFQAIGSNNTGWMGAERRHVLETSTVDDAMRLEVESQQLTVWIQRANVQRGALHKLAATVFANESMATLPAHYGKMQAELQAAIEAGNALTAAWQRFGALLEECAQMRRAAAEAGDVPQPPEALADVLSAAWAGPAPAGQSAHAPLTRDNVLSTVGFDSARRADVRVAA